MNEDNEDIDPIAEARLFVEDVTALDPRLGRAVGVVVEGLIALIADLESESESPDAPAPWVAGDLDLDRLDGRAREGWQRFRVLPPEVRSCLLQLGQLRDADPAAYERAVARMLADNP